jgi:hypothetical protein
MMSLEKIVSFIFNRSRIYQPTIRGIIGNSGRDLPAMKETGRKTNETNKIVFFNNPVPSWAGGVVSDINSALEKGGLDSVKPNNVYLPHPGEPPTSI